MSPQLTIAMRRELRAGSKCGSVLLAGVVLAVAGCGGGGGNGPAIEARSQSISFGVAPTLSLSGTAMVSAIASSGLPVSYGSNTPAICSVDSSTGVVVDIAPGICIIAASQGGNSTFAPAPQATQSIAVKFDPNQKIIFAAAPALTLGGTATVAATASSGLPVIYSSFTPAVCSIDGHSGLVTGLLAGMCVIAADQSGDSLYYAAPRETLLLRIDAPSVATVPGQPSGVSAALNAAGDAVIINIGATASGGRPIVGYSVVSHPAGLAATGSTSPVAVSCPSSCAGYAFSVSAANEIGSGASSDPVQVSTEYRVVDIFYEPDTQPRNSIFTGTFTLNSTTGSVSNLRGTLTESMTGDPYGAAPGYGMTELTLDNQLSAIGDGNGGLLVTSFLLGNTNTLSTLGGGDGWSPGSGFGLYHGFPAATNPASGGVGNAYVRIYVNVANPVAPLDQAQIDGLAYADCTAGGMMGSACMTGTTVAGYGSIGTMSGYPVSQTISKQ